MNGVLLINLGSPDSTSVRDVRRYLREFLMDRRVIDIPWLSRFLLVHGCILPFRSRRSAAAYRLVWTGEGSPLVATGRRVQRGLQRLVDMPVELAMRYQSPSITSALTALRDRGVDELLIIPLFPHYAMASFETAVVRVWEIAARVAPGMVPTLVRPYFAEPDYIAALVASAADFLATDYDHLLFSFHGLPERQLRKTDPTGRHCLASAGCCETSSAAHPTCYRAQCLATAREFARVAKLPARKVSVAFQSRLGREPWLRPFTDQELKRLAGEGVKRLLVLSPAFVADCLETLEELAIRGAETFQAAGGSEFRMIPCLNDHPRWLDCLANLVARHTAEGVTASR